jgi:hypothetical protein
MQIKEAANWDGLSKSCILFSPISGGDGPSHSDDRDHVPIRNGDHRRRDDREPE